MNDPEGSNHRPGDDEKGLVKYEKSAIGNSKGFFASMFDVGFGNYVTPRIISIYYVIAVVFFGLGVLAYILLGLFALVEGSAFGMIGMVVGPVVSFIGLMVTRMFLELVANQFKMGDNLQAIRERLERD